MRPLPYAFKGRENKACERRSNGHCDAGLNTFQGVAVAVENGGEQTERRTLHAPAVQALLIQIGSLLAVLLTTITFSKWPGIQLPLFSWVLLQGATAAVITGWRKLALWWVFIQFLFPIALVAVPMLHLPPIAFLIGFVFLLCLYWTTFQTQVPFFPSGPATWNTVAELLPQDRSLHFVDVGSGLGGLILNLAEQRPDSSFAGIEVAPLPWLVSSIRARLGRSRGRFTRGNYDHVHFKDYDVVFAYLSPAAMPDLWKKARAEMRPGTLLLSYEFAIPYVAPNTISSIDARGAFIYGWHM
jgi:hypothetical protein